MYEVYRIRGAVADVINHNGDVVPVDVRDPDLDRYADTESDTIPEAEKPPKQPVVEATGAVALGAYFCGDCLRHVGPGGCGHMRGYRGKGSRR